MSAKTLKSEVVAAAVATSGCGPEGVEVVEGAEVEQAFGRLEHLYAQLPAMEEKGAALGAPALPPRWTAWRRRRPIGRPSLSGPTRW